MSDRLSIGAIARTTGGALAARWPQFLVVLAGLGVALPAAILAYPDALSGLQSGAGVFGGLMNRGLFLAIDALLAALAIHLTLHADQADGRPLATAAEAMVRAYLPVLGIMALCRAPMLAGNVGQRWLLSQAPAGDPIGPDAGSAMGLLTLVCAITGVILTVALVTAAPAAVGERLGPGQAIRRNFVLARGRRRTIAAIAFAINLVVGLAEFSVMLLTQSLSTIEADPWLRALVACAARPATLLAAMVFAALYLEQKRLVDGGPRRMAEVFD